MCLAIGYTLLLLKNILLDYFATIYSTVGVYLGCFNLFFADVNDVALNILIYAWCV